MKTAFTYFFLFGLLLMSSCDKDCQVEGNCVLQPEIGPCEALIPKYYFDKKAKKCKEFQWGGCQGVVPFDTWEECNLCECQ